MSPKEYLRAVSRIMDVLPQDPINLAVDLLHRAWEQDRQLFLAGNGGSAATASHLVADFEKILHENSAHALRASALHDSLPTLTAWSNDRSYEQALAQTLRSRARPLDLLMLFSGSGNSPNILRAAEVAKGELGMTTIGITGGDGGRLAEQVHVAILVPDDDMQLIEDCHLAIGHALFRRLLELTQA